MNRLPAIGLRLALKPVNLLLGGLEALAGGDGAEPLPHRPVFIVGAPRCGSTLLYQALVATGTFGYLSNAHCLLYGAPGWAHGLARPFVARAAAAYSSSYGRVRGLGAPAECGEFWYRFFRRRPQHVAAGEVAPAVLSRLRGAVRLLARAMGRPLLFKNLVSSVRLQPLAEALPEALFIVLRRNEVDTSASILEGRRRLYGDLRRWFSVEPPNVERLRRLPPAEQAVEQVRAIYRLIEQDRRAIGGDRFHELSYEELCADAHGALRGLGGFLGAHGVALAATDGVPASFERHRAQTDPELVAAVERYATHGPRQEEPTAGEPATRP